MPYDQARKVLRGSIQCSAQGTRRRTGRQGETGQRLSVHASHANQPASPSRTHMPGVVFAIELRAEGAPRESSLHPLRFPDSVRLVLPIM